MRLIELHVLQSFPVTCLNRDDVGAPKSAVFGGEPRARVSSQAWKRAIRLLAREYQPDLFSGTRGHFIAEPLTKALRDRGVAEDAAAEAAATVAEALGSRDSKYKDGHKTSVALYLSPQEIEAIAEAASEKITSGGKVEVKRGDVKKALEAARPRDAADVSIFGRMVADDQSLTLEGAGMFSHALSTHRVNNDIDFFSAVDDLKPEESAGAGHIGTLEFNSACYYRYAGLNLDLLQDGDHLGHLSKDDIGQVLTGYLKAVILAVPNARHNSMFGHNPPACVLARVRKGQPLSLANAFEAPVQRSGHGYIKPSVDALRGHNDALNRTYGLNGHEQWLDTSDKESPDLETFITGVVSHV